MDESGDGWLRESASRRAGVTQSPDGRRAITIFDPPLKEPCRDQHTVRARHPEGSSVSLARAGPRTSESRVACRHRGSDPFQSQPRFSIPFGGYRARVSGPQIQSYSALAENQGFRPPLKSQGELHPPGTPTFRDPSPSNPREEKGGSCHRTDGVPPEGAVASLLGNQTGISMASLSGATRETTVSEIPGEKGGSCHRTDGVPPEGAVASLSGTVRGIATPHRWCPRGLQSLLTLSRRMANRSAKAEHALA